MTIWSKIQTTASTRVWNKGKKYSNTVYITHKDELELEALVVAGKKEYEIYLGFEDEEWDCDCHSTEKVCEHICAAAIAFRDNTLKKEEDRIAKFDIQYRLEVKNKSLYLHRETQSNKPQEIKGSLFSRSDVNVNDFDRELERHFSGFFGSMLNRHNLAKFLTFMEKHKSGFMFDNKKVYASSKESGSMAIVEDDDEGFRVRIIRDPNIVRVVTGYAVLYKSGSKRKEIRCIGTNGLTTSQYQTFLRGVVYGFEDVKRLLSRIIPELEKRVPVDIRTDRLPKNIELKPYLRIETQVREDSLLFQPKIVYGDPPIAEIKGDDIIFLGKEIPIRDQKEEEIILFHATQKLRKPIGIEQTFTAEDAIVMADHLQKLAKENPSWKIVGGALKSFHVKGALEPALKVEESELTVDFGDVDPEKVFDAWFENRTMVQLNTGGWAPLPKDWLNEYGYLVADLLSAKRAANGKMPKYAMFDLARLCERLDQDVPELGGLRSLISDFSGIKHVELPQDLRADLREYQHVGVNWLSFLKKVQIGGILADDMGLGKTVQTLCVLERRSLVVVPTSVLYNWKREGEKFRPSLKMYIYHGTSRKWNTEADVVLTSYAILRNDLEQFCSEEWDVIVLDEAQAIKNPRSQTAQAAFCLKAKFRVALTGTPIENRLEELWSQMHFLCPGFLSGIKNFRKQYEIPISNGDNNVAKRLRERIKPFVLRRLKKNVAKELPPRTNVTLYCDLSKDERALYDAVRVSTQERIVQALEEGKSFSVMSALEALLRLRQASCHSGLLPNQAAPTSSKIELLMERLVELTSAGHKALVFSQWTKFLDRIEPHLIHHKISFVRLDGSTKNRDEIVCSFQSSDGPSIFLASLKAGGTGLNLTAADHVFLMDPWWNPAAEEQAADRAYRIGQDKPVNVYRIVCSDTVEEKVLLLQDKKRKIADAALNEATYAAKITKEDLMNLLE